ncbi:hypothetical protein FA15DRAFT_711325 [Coprinopsis marcescibilis]|uniref:DNA 3'-5' helicase n=1 Tax=Coprinopsis marcescibilis TaxID=230819 RepID=A0A5C3KAI2_COPMA|nr:hypothetical protein FA15DRAFT_711325 [Coprinopsis marcescibilis]
MASVFSTEEGFTRIREILALGEPEPIIPHDYQLEGIAASLDGQDLLATLATGTGKTGYYTFLMLVIKAIAHNPSKTLSTITFHANPVMLVVLPTKALQEDMKRGMCLHGLNVIAINSDEVKSARKTGRDLWTECIENYDVILISPEELTSRHFEALLNKPKFTDRICCFGVDEVHLINTWGRHSARPLTNWASCESVFQCMMRNSSPLSQHLLPYEMANRNARFAKSSDFRITT